MPVEKLTEATIVSRKDFKPRMSKNERIIKDERPEWMKSTIIDQDGKEIPIGEWLSKNYNLELRGGT